ncbi:MAG: M1 family metallopeptidase [Candidatus Woesearchaeota archaeon]|nr:M1 family metallopeptidase [Candidatus Woesearchaeota archaeon]
MKKNPYLLPDTAKPREYVLEITPDFQKGTFTGKEDILITIGKKTKTIVLHAKDVVIDRASLPNMPAANIEYDETMQTVVLSFPKPVSEGNTILMLAFHGTLRNDLRGFYKSKYTVSGKEKIMATTQFEATDARTCFPCFDEPAQKAIFGVTLVVPKELTAISNMPIKKETPLGQTKRVEFEKTPIMSTYLLAFLIAEFEGIEQKTKDNVLVRVFTTPGRKEQGRFALDVAVKSLEYYHDYFGVPYPLPKLDLIAVPDFESGAMENWGAVTYRETALLIDEKNSAAAAKQRVAIVVAHELAHQWFGNLVTMHWWDDLWLNEGFASWMEYKAVDHMFPNWDMWTQFYTEDVDTALSLDGLETSHPIEVPVINPEEIGEIFDAVSYSKGACIIHMLEQYLGPDTFRKGLQHYVKQFSYANTVTNDLWKSLEDASGKPVKKMMETWTKQMGYPVVSATVKNNTLTLSQQHFLYTGKKDTTRWHIPIAVQQSGEKTYHDMHEKKMVIAGVHEATVTVNPSQVGFYRVSYDDALLEQQKKLFSDMTILDKASMQGNQYALARSGYRSSTVFLDMLPLYTEETDYTIWAEIVANLGEIKFLLAHTPLKEPLDLFSRKLVGSILGKVGWDEKKTEEHTTILLRAVILGTTGLSGDETVIKEAQRRFEAHRANKNMNPNLRSVVYAVTARNGGRKEYDQLKQLYREAPLQEEKMRLLGALTMFKQEDLLQETLAFTLSPEVRSQDIISGMARVAANSYGTALAWDFFKKNWDEIKKRYGDGGHMLGRLIKELCSRFSTPEKATEITEFFKAHPVPSAKRAIAQSLEAIRINHAFVEKSRKEIEMWIGKR